MKLKLSNLQARRFLLKRHGLTGKHLFTGKEGIMSFVRRVGCVQFDPVDVCGRNADIVLNSRIRGYRKSDLEELLYKDRRLVDYFDKNLSIFPVEDLPVFLTHHSTGSYAAAYERRGGEAVKQIEEVIRQLIKERGFISAKEVDTDKTIEGPWSITTSLPRAALESMYFRGELIIHHKTGMNKSYAFLEDYIPAEVLSAGLPFRTEEERYAWHIKRRIGAVGILWNKASDAWLGLHLKAAGRTAAYEKLLADGEIFEIEVEGIKDPLYVREDEREALEAASMGKPSGKAPKPRAEFIAPLDSLIWDRKLISALFGFDYKWEIYTPKESRKYSAYTLPILYGDGFVGRVDAARKDGRLVINNVWTIDGKPLDGKVKEAFEECADRFIRFNDTPR